MSVSQEKLLNSLHTSESFQRDNRLEPYHIGHSLIREMEVLD